MILQCLMGNYFIEHYNRLVNLNSSIILELNSEFFLKWYIIR